MSESRHRQNAGLTDAELSLLIGILSERIVDAQKLVESGEMTTDPGEGFRFTLLDKLVAVREAVTGRTFIEYRCRDHPNDGWWVDWDWWYHLETVHGIGQAVWAESRLSPIPRPKRKYAA